MRSNSQSRKWDITINNPSQAELTHDVIKDILQTRTLRYWCMADEIGRNGTYHTHIFVLSDSPTYFSMWKKLLPIAHIEKAYGSAKENRDYVSKTGKWAESDKAETSVPGTFEEWGTLPSETAEKEPVMTQVIKWIEEGLSTAEIIRLNPKMAFRSKDIDLLRETILSEKYMREKRLDLEVIYLYGKTGTGKTSSIYEKYDSSEVCRITNYKGDRILFDGYHGQRVLVLEEFRSQIPLADLLSILDIYPLMLPARYSDRVACYSVVYIVSNEKLSAQYSFERLNQRDTWEAFIRRINHIYEQLDHGCVIEKKKEDILTW